MEPNDRQRESIESTHPNNCVVAGPGTGKSKVLLLRAARLAGERGVDPSRVVLVSFTNASVADLRRSIDGDDTFAPARDCRITTFHSLALRCLRRMDTAATGIFVADDWEELNLIDVYLKSALGLRRVDEAERRRRDFNARWCQTAESPDEWLDQNQRREFLRAFNLVRGALDLITRGELTYRWWKKLVSEPEASNADLAIDFDHILVDEYQDLNECDHGILGALARRGVEVFVAGDANQSIYELLRHAHPQVCISFPENFPNSHRVVLDETYRCPPAILRAASSLMARTPGHDGVPTVSRRGIEGQFELVNFADHTAEASGVARVAEALTQADPAARILILVPARKIGELVSKELRVDHNPAFRRQRDPETDKHRLAVAFARLLGNASDSLAAATAVISGDAKARRLDNLNGIVKAFELTGQTAAQLLAGDAAELPNPLGRAAAKARERLAQLRAKGIEEAIAALEQASGTTGLERYLQPPHRRHREGTPQVTEEAVPDESVGDDEPNDLPAEAPLGITISTYHSSKGLEAEFVFLMAVEPEQFEDDTRSTREEKRRLLYVGLTRARDATFASYASSRYGPSRYLAPAAGTPRRGMSEFLADLMDELDLTPVGGTAFVQRYVPT